ncbi:hypothetical protein AX774_g4391 [Zancudomyces culisetae]|uniref:Uncharacterized protein n=1 Tax=Zancudomyces culisetae TaxID=1213189 RepID=A0A1R1PME2_ZANCU|nr:hypothetical protein AX774_g4391 [Zancudomyces culisetae]|eukprot:OMH82140.1 hypothetical protein AX774_g4391 [Zancudomyces culisetae]
MSSAILNFLKNRGLCDISIKEPLNNIFKLPFENFQFVQVRALRNSFRFTNKVNESLSNYNYLLKYIDPKEYRVYFFNDKDKIKYLSEELDPEDKDGYQKLHASTLYSLFQINIKVKHFKDCGHIKPIAEALKDKFGDIVDIRANSLFDHPASLKYVSVYIKRCNSKAITDKRIYVCNGFVPFTATRITDYVPI